MSRPRSTHHPIFCALPPHILRRVAEHGPSELRDHAQRTLDTDHHHRQRRHTSGGKIPPDKRSRALQEGVPAQHRTIYTAGGSWHAPGEMVRKEDQPPSRDEAVNEAYSGLGATFDLYWNEYQRNSVDDQGLPLEATVHFGEKYDNAFWSGEQMLFGDGDGQLFNRFTIAIDVIGHELTHGVTQYEARLIFMFEPGALNESISDVFGTLVKQRHLAQGVTQADWLIGAGLFTDKVKGVAMRSMKAPGTAYDDPVLGRDPQPAHMRDYRNDADTWKDQGGVHINSGIPNHAFYLAAMAIGGYAWERAGRIWYHTLCDPRLPVGARFRDFAALTIDNAARLYGDSGSEREAVRGGWSQVGIEVDKNVLDYLRSHRAPPSAPATPEPPYWTPNVPQGVL